MDCRAARTVLSAYHDGELSGSEREQVESHLRACPDCAALLEALARVDAAAEVPAPGPEYWRGFNRRVEERLGRGETRPEATVVPHPRRGWMRQQLRYLVPAVAAAAMVVVIVRHIGLDSAPQVPPVPPSAREAAPAPASREFAPPPAHDRRAASVARDSLRGPAERTAAEKTRAAEPIRPPAVPPAEGAKGTGAPAAYPRLAEGKSAVPQAAPAAESAQEKPDRPATAGIGIDRADAAKTLSDATDRRKAPGAIPRSGASQEAPASGSPPGAASERENALSTAGERVTTMMKAPEEFRSRKDETAGAAVTMSDRLGRSETAAKSEEVLSRRRAVSPCEEARSLAAKGRFKEAEAAQRACLAGDTSPQNQESGLVLLAELLDRQNRFAEADSVLEQAQNRFPRNRPLEDYRKQRALVQSGRVPFPSIR